MIGDDWARQAHEIHEAATVRDIRRMRSRPPATSAKAKSVPMLERSAACADIHACLQGYPQQNLQSRLTTCGVRKRAWTRPKKLSATVRRVTWQTTCASGRSWKTSRDEIIPVSAPHNDGEPDPRNCCQVVLSTYTTGAASLNRYPKVLQCSCQAPPPRRCKAQCKRASDGDNTNRQVSLRILGFFRRSGNRIKSDISKEDDGATGENHRRNPFGINGCQFVGLISIVRPTNNKDQDGADLH